MTQTPRRSGIRLPWSHDDEEAEDEQTAGTEATTATDAAGTAGSPDAAAPGDAQSAAAPARAPQVAEGTGVSEVSDEDNVLLVSLITAMREVAERERTASMGGLKSSADDAIDRMRVRAAEAAEQLRSRADLDMAGIGEWVRTETERIEAEGRAKTEARRQQLDQQLTEHGQRTERDIEGVRTRVADYERQLSAFFTQLYEIGDPGVFGTAAKRMPRPPDLGLTETAAAVAPPAPPEATAPPAPAPGATDVTDAPGASSATIEEDAGPDTAPEVHDEAAGVETVAGTDVAGEAPADAVAPEDASAASEDAGNEPAEAPANGAAAETLRDRMDALGISREPAPMPGEDEADGKDASTSTGLAARLRELDARIGSSEPVTGEEESAVTTLASPAPGGEVATAIMVSGLGSFGAITSFKQALERVEGVHGISLSLGPTGEFVYRATHGTGFDLAAAIEQIERGTAKIDRQADGSLRVTVQRGR